jgi:hypothetical protein
VALGALLAAPLAASAAPYPLPTHENGTISRTQCSAGDKVVFSGSGYAVNGPGSSRQRLTVTDNGKKMGTTPVGDNGAFSYSFTIRSNTPIGKHTYVARGKGANTADRDTTAVCYVTGITQSAGQPVSTDGAGGGAGASDGDGGGNLAFTGADILTMVATALGLIALGALLVWRNLSSRRVRRRRTAVA